MLQRKSQIFIALLLSPLLLFFLYKSLELPAILTATLFLIGGLLGATLNYFQSGFSSSFRSFILEKRTAGMRAIIWMLGIAIVLFAPLLAIGSWQDQTFNGFIRTLSLAIPIGALIFGIGMQIGCGCTSGTLNRVGQMQTLSVSTLFFMVIGGTLAAYTFEYWGTLPAIEPFAFQVQFGWGLGLMIQIALLSGLYAWLKQLEKRHHQEYEVLFKVQDKYTFRHPYLIAAFSMAILNTSLLFISGSPWSISSIFPYWGTHLIDLFKLPLDWGFWDYSMENATRMNQGLLENTVSLTTMGVVLGAFAVSLFRPRVKVSINVNRLAGSVFGGLIMGFGAVMASGCNIGAFFSGIASGSLHGWVWLVFALIGNVIGLAIRRRLI